MRSITWLYSHPARANPIPNTQPPQCDLPLPHSCRVNILAGEPMTTRRPLPSIYIYVKTASSATGYDIAKPHAIKMSHLPLQNELFWEPTKFPWFMQPWTPSPQSAAIPDSWKSPTTTERPQVALKATIPPHLNCIGWIYLGYGVSPPMAPSTPQQPYAHDLIINLRSNLASLWIYLVWLALTPL